MHDAIALNPHSYAAAGRLVGDSSLLMHAGDCMAGIASWKRPAADITLPKVKRASHKSFAAHA